ncbi:MAG: BamA/TamA family outer membrane protein [Pirellulales bacterium]|nr:BamA/TamA family outer membrane protein [Pirellulales bacterium]
MTMPAVLPAVLYRPTRLLPWLACLTVLVGVVGCQSAPWQFSQGESLGLGRLSSVADSLPPPPGPIGDFRTLDASPESETKSNTWSNTRPQEVQYSGPPAWSRPTGQVVRAQFTPDAGRAVPSLLPSQPMQPSGTTSSEPSNLSPLQSAQAAPAYGQNYGQPAGPSNWGEPYLPGRFAEDPSRGVLDDLNDFGNEPFDDDPFRTMTLAPTVQGRQTGRFTLGVGVNSDVGLMGTVMVEEQNFNWARFPRGWADIRNATAWRGAGQKLRLEAMPGTEVQRYIIDFQNPYLFRSDYSLGLGFHLYTRRYLEWDEDRLGGRVALGYLLKHGLTASIAYRGMKVSVYDPVNPAPQDLTDALGDSTLHGFQFRLINDTRDSAYLATQGHLLQFGVEQVVGTYSYPRLDAEYRRYFLLKEHPDGTQRHVIGLRGSVAWSGSDTPIYERFFPGGFSTIRGFDFRGASPRDPATGVIVGGNFEMYASIEYLFPITADDMLSGVVFCDTGTAEPTIDHWTDNYRVAPGFGLRIKVAAMGSAPIALDFAFPVSHNRGDRFEMFSFNIGFFR